MIHCFVADLKRGRQVMVEVVAWEWPAVFTATVCRSVDRYRKAASFASSGTYGRAVNKIAHDGPDRYLIQGGTCETGYRFQVLKKGADRPHTVNLPVFWRNPSLLEAGLNFCDCQDAVYRDNKDCKHFLTVWAILEEREKFGYQDAGGGGRHFRGRVPPPAEPF